MLRKLNQFRSSKRLKAKYCLFNNRAIINKYFEVGFHAEILNESGDKNQIVIGHHCRLSGVLFCKTTGKIEIGNFSTIQDGVLVKCLQHVKIGHYVGIGDGSVLMDNDDFHIDPQKRVKHMIRIAPGGSGYSELGNGSEMFESSPIIIGDVVWIGSNSVVFKGVKLGEGCIIARNSTVFGDIPPYTIAAGNPARVVKELTKPDFKYYEV